MGLELASFVSDSDNDTIPPPSGCFRKADDVGEIRVGRGGSSVQVDGQVVELTQRNQLARVVQALADAHTESPGEWIECPRLIDAAWQGERMNTSSAMNRLHVAMATLRKLGLRSVLQSKKGAYRLRSDLRVVLAAG